MPKRRQTKEIGCGFSAAWPEFVKLGGCPPRSPWPKRCAGWQDAIGHAPGHACPPLAHAADRWQGADGHMPVHGCPPTAHAGDRWQGTIGHTPGHGCTAAQTCWQRPSDHMPGHGCPAALPRTRGPEGNCNIGGALDGRLATGPGLRRLIRAAHHHLERYLSTSLSLGTKPISRPAGRRPARRQGGA